MQLKFHAQHANIHSLRKFGSPLNRNWWIRSIELMPPNMDSTIGLHCTWSIRRSGRFIQIASEVALVSRACRTSFITKPKASATTAKLSTRSVRHWSHASPPPC